MDKIANARCVPELPFQARIPNYQDHYCWVLGLFETISFVKLEVLSINMMLDWKPIIGACYQANRQVLDDEFITRETSETRSC